MTGPLQRPGAQSCLVCEAPIALLDAGTAPICHRSSCRWTHRTLPRWQACRACGRPLSASRVAAGTCDRDTCRHAALAARLRRIRADSEEQVRVMRERSARVAGLTASDTVRVVHIPGFTATLRPLARRRREAFRRRLLELIAASAASEDEAGSAPDAASLPAPEVSAEIEAISGRACGSCRGWCCKTGGEHAWLTVATIRRYRTARPDLGPAEVEAAYLSRLGERVYHGSCVYHGPAGCTLSREMRSETCNRFFCDGLAAFRREAAGDSVVRGLFVWGIRDGVRAGVFIDSRGTRRIRAPRPQG